MHCINPTPQQPNQKQERAHLQKPIHFLSCFNQMLILFQKLCHSLKSNRLDNISPDPEALSASFRAFRSETSKILSQIMLEAKPGSKFLSLEWMFKCFELIPMINKAFAKLVVDVNYPFSKWDVAVAEEWLNYSMNNLDLLNTISSLLSHLSQARLQLSHSLSLFEYSPSSASKHLHPLRPDELGKNLKLESRTWDDEKQGFSGKELIIHDALKIVRSTGNLLFGIIISGLSSDGNAYFDLRKSAGNLLDPSFKNLDLILCEEKWCIVKEVKEVNDAAVGLIEAIEELKAKGEAAAAAKELSSKLDVFKSLIDGLSNKTDHQFSEILAARNKLIDIVRHKHND